LLVIKIISYTYLCKEHTIFFNFPMSSMKIKEIFCVKKNNYFFMLKNMILYCIINISHDCVFVNSNKKCKQTLFLWKIIGAAHMHT